MTPKKTIINRGGDGDRKVTLSGLPNFIDRLLSAFDEEQLIMLTTNHIEDLDKALIRMGWMDKKIELSYCDFETFKSLAKICLDVNSHRLFGDVEPLLPEVDLVLTDVVKHLAPMNPHDNVSSCLARLVSALHKEKAAKAKKGATANAQRQDGDIGE
uniref:ATPase AAA-type core domain-containing protein n=1 Tax=Oryza punctata TaxID=4537 RepID=A0A0E0KHP0_ORYPU